LLALRSTDSPWNVQQEVDMQSKESEATLGLLVLASPDPQRFQSSMGTDLLTRIAELASAALSRLR
jgi:uncharacterized protein YigA (DUF484 family)